MANLKDKIDKDFKEALKKKDSFLISVLRLLKSSIHNLEIEKRANLKDEEMYDLIKKEIKNRQEAIEQFKKGKREDLVKKEEKEIKILTSYLKSGKIA